MNIKKIIPICIKNFIKTKLLSKKNPTCIFKGNTNIGLNTKFGKFVTLFENVEIGFTSFIDDYTYIQQNTFILNSNIGKFCSIAKNVTIGLVGHPTNMVSTNPCFYDYDEGLLPKFFVNTSLEKETLIISTTWKTHSYGKSDIYVSFRKPDGSYSTPKNIGPTINSLGNEGTPFIAADKKLFIFIPMVGMDTVKQMFLFQKD